LLTPALRINGTSRRFMRAAPEERSQHNCAPPIDSNDGARSAGLIAEAFLQLDIVEAQMSEAASQGENPKLDFLRRAVTEPQSSSGNVAGNDAEEQVQHLEHRSKTLEQLLADSSKTMLEQQSKLDQCHVQLGESQRLQAQLNFSQQKVQHLESQLRMAKVLQPRIEACLYRTSVRVGSQFASEFRANIAFQASEDAKLVRMRSDIAEIRDQESKLRQHVAELADQKGGLERDIQSLGDILNEGEIEYAQLQARQRYFDDNMSSEETHDRAKLEHQLVVLSAQLCATTEQNQKLNREVTETVAREKREIQAQHDITVATLQRNYNRDATRSEEWLQEARALAEEKTREAAHYQSKAHAASDETERIRESMDLKFKKKEEIIDAMREELYQLKEKLANSNAEVQRLMKRLNEQQVNAESQKKALTRAVACKESEATLLKHTTEMLSAEVARYEDRSHELKSKEINRSSQLVGFDHHAVVDVLAHMPHTECTNNQGPHDADIHITAQHFLQQELMQAQQRAALSSK